jgi:O-antigen ligase
MKDGARPVAAIAASVGLIATGLLFLSPQTLIEVSLVALAAWMTVATRARLGRSAQPLQSKALVWPVYLFPLAYGARGLLGTTTVLAAIAGLALLTLRPRVARVPTWIYALLFALVAHVILSPPAPGAAWVAIGSCALAHRVVTRFPRDRVVASVIDGVGLYLAANVLLYLFGIRSLSAATRTGGLEVVGGGERVFYPLAQSIMTAPTMAAIFLAASLMFYEPGRARRAARFTYAACAVLVLIRADSRYALAIAVIMTGLSLMQPTLQKRIALPLAAFCLASAFLFPVVATSVVQPLVRQAGASFSGLDARQGDQRNETLNGRSIIWERATNFWSSSVTDSSEKLFGFGALGQAKSGASGTYAELFEGGYSEARLASTHNATLQQLYDGGYVGVAAFCLFVLAGLWQWTRLTAAGLFGRYGLAAILAAVLSGVTEVMVSPGFGHEPFWILVLLILTGWARPDSEHATRSSAVRSRLRGARSGNGGAIPARSLPARAH